LQRCALSAWTLHKTGLRSRFGGVTLGLGAWPGRFRCGSSKT